MKFLSVILICAVFVLWQVFGNSPNVFHNTKTQIVSFPSYLENYANDNTGGIVLLGNSAFQQANAQEWANVSRGDLSMSFRKLECANDYG